MKKVYLYYGTVKSEFAPNGIFPDIWIAITGHTQARQALAAHFRVEERDVSIKAVRDTAGRPLECFAGVEESEQCWADRDGEHRCANKARPGFHTCKIHTSFDAPAPFGTPEFLAFIDSDGNLLAPDATSAKSKGTTPKKRSNAAKRRTRRRDRPSE